ncbi:cytochrome [Moniliophthora roreri]|nr:cytochrome [Moniliophthora roreri]
MLTVPWLDSNLVTFILLSSLAWLVPKILRVGRRESYLPPGPPKIPILGNLHVFPTASAHIKFAEWGQQYGDIYSLKISSGNAVVVNSMEAAAELLDKRGATTAERPKLHMVDKVTNGLNLALCRYSDTWRMLRKAAHTILTPKAVEKHLPIQVAEATQVLYDFLTDPDDFFKHIGRYSNSVIMSVLFGKRCPRYETHESTAFFETMELWNLCISPTAVPPVDLLPFLDYVPERWAWWKGLAAKTRQKQRELYFGLVDECEQRMKRGEENGSYIEEILTKQKELGLDREMVGYLGGVLLEGGSETTTSFLKYLVMALVSFPDVQGKAQAEIDRVVGKERMPSLADVKDLPYTPYAACYNDRRRISRFHHTEGHNHIRDFDDPDTFNPDRYLLNDMGNEIPVSLDHYEKNGLLPTPLPFKCQIIPRNQSVVNIVEREFKEATETFVKFERDLVPADKEWVDELRNNLSSTSDGHRTWRRIELEETIGEKRPDIADLAASELSE